MSLFRSTAMLLFLVAGILPANAQHSKVQHAFTLQETPAVVEGMAFDPADSIFYFGESLNYKILKYTKQGKPAGFIDAAKDGIISILGMSVSPAAHHLWVCGAIQMEGKKTMCMFQYNLDDNSLMARYPDTSQKARLFNDVAITNDGSVYTTDTYTGALYKMDMRNKIATRFLRSDSLRHCNGITAHGNILFISTSNGFARVNTADTSVTISRLNRYLIAGNDGLYFYKQSLIGIQNVLFPFTIARYFLDSDGKKISKASILAVEHPAFAVPTTGAIVNEDFYFMANSNIEHYDFENNKQLNMDAIRNIRIFKISLKPKG